MMVFLKQIFLFVALSFFSISAMAWGPTQPITVVVPAPAGALHDAAFRTVLEQLESKGLKFNFDYKPGAGGAVGTKHFLNLPNDNHTFLISFSLSHTTGPLSNPKVASWDSVKDFQFVHQLVASPLVVAVSSESDIVTIKDLVNKLRNSKKPLNIGIVFPHQQAVMIELAERENIPLTKLNFVNYDNPSKVVTDIINKNLDLTLTGVSPTVALKDSGKIRWVASTASKDLDILSNVPTLNSVYPNLGQISVGTVIMHKDTPKEVVDYYQSLLKSATMTDQAQQARSKIKCYFDDNLSTPSSLKLLHEETRKKLKPIWEAMNKTQ